MQNFCNLSRETIIGNIVCAEWRARWDIFQATVY